MDNSGTKRLWVTLLLVVPAIFQIFPVVYLICVSFKLGPEVIQYPPVLLPKQLTLANYSAAFETAPLVRFLWNSIFVSAVVTVFQIFTALLAAYVLARFEFRGKAVLTAFILGTMMVPGEITILPNYFTLASWDWLDTYYALIVPFSVSAFGIFLLYQFFKTIPKELEEAAVVDGVSPLRFLFQILVPISYPALVGFGIYAFVSTWNQYLWPLVVTQSTPMQTAQIGIGMFRAQTESASWGIIMAATVVLISPTVLLFLATQKQFVRGMTMSGLKG